MSKLAMASTGTIADKGQVEQQGQGQGQGLVSVSPAIPTRPKRRQVARACDWCRGHRVRCDNERPCANCRSRGGRCTSNGESEVRTLPHALREIEKLKHRIKELERQVEGSNCLVSNSNNAVHPPSPPQSLEMASPDEPGPKSQERPRRYWEGIHTRTAKSHQTQLYGPSSLFYFIGRMSSYLATALQQPHLDHQFQPSSASRSFASPTSSKNGSAEESLMSADIPVDGDYLTGTQEDYFLNLFWQSYHCTLQILDEREFREHYKSLWDTSGKARKPSALVDIVLAVCMQYGVAFLPRPDANSRSKADVDSNDATIAGRWFYRRSQALLATELESPSISTLQCHILSHIYLCSASFQNMSHSTLALAVRTAHILGLHLEPPEDMPRGQRELRKRLWWTLFALESKTSMKHGRPFVAYLGQVAVNLPADDQELALQSGSNFGTFGEDITWITYNLHNTKLLLAVRSIYTAFYDKCADILGANDGKSLYNDPQGLESCAEFLFSSMKALHTDWLSAVPNALKMKREKPGRPFSTDTSALDIEPFAPQWLKRQQILLELLYHNLSMNLYRPFITFSTTSDSLSTTNSHALSCASHAISLTHIMHQVLRETDLLHGWHEAYQWQWNAALTLIGFILAHPSSPSTHPARSALTNAIAVFEIFGNNFAMAASAANVTRDLTAKADFLSNRVRGNGDALSTGSAYFAENGNALLGYYPGGYGFVQADGGNDSSGVVDGVAAGAPQLDDQAMQDAIAGSLGMAFTIDSFNSFEPLWVGGAGGEGGNGNGIGNGVGEEMDYWTFTQD